MAKKSKHKRGPPSSRRAKTADHCQSDPKSSSAVQSSGEHGKGETSSVMRSITHDKSGENVVMLYVAVTLLHATALWAIVKMMPALGVELSSNPIHIVSDVLDRIRECLFYVHAYLAAKAWFS